MKNNQTDQYKKVGKIQRPAQISHAPLMSLCMTVTLCLERDQYFDIFMYYNIIPVERNKQPLLIIIVVPMFKYLPIIIEFNNKVTQFLCSWQKPEYMTTLRNGKLKDKVYTLFCHISLPLSSGISDKLLDYIPYLLQPGLS